MQIVNPNANRGAQFRPTPPPAPDTHTGDTGPKQGLSLRHISAHLQFTLFLALVGMVFIFNAHYAERQLRQYDALQRDVKKLRDAYTMQQASLSAASSLEALRKAADSLGLQPLDKPPFKIYQHP